MPGPTPLRRRILVSMPVRHEATLRIARVLDREGLLESLQVPLDASRTAERAGKWQGPAGPLASKLRQWSYAPRASSAARLPELVTAADYFVGRRLGRSGYPQLVSRWRHWAVDRTVARRIARKRPAAFIGLEGMCLHAARCAVRAGARPILFARTDIWGVNQAARRLASAAGSDAERREILAEMGERWERSVNDTLAIVGGVLVESPRMRDLVVSNGADPSRVTVLGQGVNLDAFRFVERDYASRPLRAALVGRIGHGKGVLHAAEAVRRAPAAVESLSAIGWDIRSSDVLRRLTPWVRYTGHLNLEGVLGELAAADVFVLPTLADSMARSILEAMATGLPVVTTPVSGYEGVIRDGVEGFFVPVEDPDAIAARLRQLAEDGGLRRKMGFAARARAEEFGWGQFEGRFRQALYSGDGAFAGLDL